MLCSGKDNKQIKTGLPTNIKRPYFAPRSGREASWSFLPEDELNKYIQLIELTYCEKYLPVSLIYPLQKS